MADGTLPALSLPHTVILTSTNAPIMSNYSPFAYPKDIFNILLTTHTRTLPLPLLMLWSKYTLFRMFIDNAQYVLRVREDYACSPSSVKNLRMPAPCCRKDLLLAVAVQRNGLKPRWTLQIWRRLKVPRLLPQTLRTIRIHKCAPYYIRVQ